MRQMTPNSNSGNGRIFGSQTPYSNFGIWPFQRTNNSYLGTIIISFLCIIFYWYFSNRSYNTTYETQTAHIALLERKIRDLEDRHARTHLDMAQQVQRLVTEQTSTLLTGPLIQKHYPPTLTLPSHMRKRILVTGGAGFVGSHLVDALMVQGHNVYVLDNLFTGRSANIEHWFGHPRFQFFQQDVVQPFYIEVDEIYHLACPASPPHYMYNPIKTIKTSTSGTLNMLGLAKRVKARLLFTSTSEVYGDPEVHPQNEDYWGNVNTMGPRSCYDEGKRVGETLCYSYNKEEGVPVRIARIFNTFGPRMHPNDGRVVSNFIIQALKNDPLTIYGDGSQTRSFQYVSDLVTGLIKLMNSDYERPINIGNPDEYTVKVFADKIRKFVGSNSEIQNLPATQDDPKQRRPDITRAKNIINWQPKITVDEGLYHTVEYFRSELGLNAPEDNKNDQLSKNSFKRDTPPLWTASIINDGLTNKEKGLEEV